MRPAILACVLLFVTTNRGAHAADFNGRWHWTGSEPPLLGWKEIAFGHGIFLASAMSQQAHFLYSSRDGREWKEVLIPGSTIYHLDFIHDRFIGCSREGMLTSIDGNSWRLYPMEQRFRSAYAYGNGVYVAVGGSRNVAVSDEGITWKEHPLPPLEPGSELQGIAFGNGRFVAVGRHGTLLTSNDGKQWQQHPWVQGLPVPDYSRVALTYNKGRFIYGNFTSVDGVAWQTTGPGGRTTGNIRVASDGKLLSASSGGIEVSEGGLTWDLVFRPPGITSFNSVAYGNNYYVAVGDYGMVARKAEQGEWEMVGGGWKGSHKLVFGDGQFLRYGGTNVHWSTDAQAWAPQDAPEVFSEVVHGNGRFLALGASSQLYRYGNGEWVPVHEVMTNSTLRFVGDYFMVRQTNGSLGLSADTEHWREVKMEEEPFRSVAYGNGVYLAMGFRYVYSSSDAVNWEQIAPAPTYGYRLTFGNGRFLFAGNGGMGPPNLYMSEDGREWQEFRAGTSHLFDGFGFAAGHFYMLDWSGAVHFSRDGLRWDYNWVKRMGISSLAVGNGLMVIGVAGDVVLWKHLEERPVQWLPVEISLAGEKLRLSGSVGNEPVQIERSANLAEWQPVLTLNQRDTNYDVELGGSLESGFFRARAVELDFVE